METGISQKSLNEIITKLDALNTKLDSVNLSESSTAAQNLISIVPLLGIIAGAVIFFFYLLWRYKLQKELIKQGTYKSSLGKRVRVTSLLIGFVATLAGIPMTILFIIIDGASYTLLGGLIPLFTGLGLLLFYFFSILTIKDS